MGIVSRGVEGLSSHRQWEQEAQRRENGITAPDAPPREGDAGPGFHRLGASDPQRDTRPPGSSEEPVMVSATAALGSPAGS